MNTAHLPCSYDPCHTAMAGLVVFIFSGRENVPGLVISSTLFPSSVCILLFIPSASLPVCGIAGSTGQCRRTATWPRCCRRRTVSSPRLKTKYHGQSSLMGKPKITNRLLLNYPWNLPKYPWNRDFPDRH